MPLRLSASSKLSDLAQEKWTGKSWGYDRIAWALANLGHEVADQTVGSILKHHGIPLAPERRKTTTWRKFICSHMDVLVVTDFFTTEVWTQGGLVTYYVLFFIHLATRRVHVAGITPHPNEQWMTPVARNVTMADVGVLSSSLESLQHGARPVPKFDPVPSIYSSARPELDRSPVSRDHACMISSFVRARPLARPQTQTLSC